jgi:tetratricopeptide (TPR) repeat protein
LAYQTTLGIVHYRRGSWDEAMETLEAVAQRSGVAPSGAALCVLAMAQHQADRRDLAEQNYALAQAKLQITGAATPEEQLLLEEAASLFADARQQNRD